VAMLTGCLVLLAVLHPASAEDSSEFTRTRDVIYGKKYGMALTMDVFAPTKKANGAAVIAVISGGFFSRPEMIQPVFYSELVKRGYVVFAVLHGSQPKYTIPEIVGDMNRAVRFIRFHAKDYHIDPQRIGIVGASAGGHLSLMQGTAGDAGDPKATDPVERASSRVQAVGCFFPPTDFMNFGGLGQEHYGDVVGLPFRPAFDYHELDKKQNRFVRITDKEKLREISRKISPITHVTSDTPPTLIIHGDKDRLVPIQQSQLIGNGQITDHLGHVGFVECGHHLWAAMMRSSTIRSGTFDPQPQTTRGTRFTWTNPAPFFRDGVPADGTY
jgi:acetyl esterase/lipase